MHRLLTYRVFEGRDDPLPLIAGGQHNGRGLRQLLGSGAVFVVHGQQTQQSGHLDFGQTRSSSFHPPRCTPTTPTPTPRRSCQQHARHSTTIPRIPRHYSCNHVHGYQGYRSDRADMAGHAGIRCQAEANQANARNPARCRCVCHIHHSYSRSRFAFTGASFRSSRWSVT